MFFTGKEQIRICSLSMLQGVWALFAKVVKVFVVPRFKGKNV